MTNTDLSLMVFSVLKQAGADTVVVCAGARNAPLVLNLQSDSGFKVFQFFEERSAAFFALGLIRAGQKPVAILTTSGTAAAELLPAVIEAHYQGLPMILVTADRPKAYRGTGSPQTIQQPGLFSAYVENVYDLDVHTKDYQFKWSLKNPLHLNVAFDEPLIDHAGLTPILPKLELIPVRQAKAVDMGISKAPFIILGDFPQANQPLVLEFLLRTKAPVYAESLSQMKKSPELRPLLIRSSELVKPLFKMNLCDSVIRIGGVPTLRFWRDLENEFCQVPVFNFSHLEFSGLARNSDCSDLQSLQKVFIEFQSDKMQQIKNFDEVLETEKQKLLAKYPLSEQNFTKKIAEVVSDDPVYLGNSLPIRNWDEFADCRSAQIYANRGANGIDGQLSTYLGWSEKTPRSFCYVGDLTALYDLAALGLGPQLNMGQRHIVVLNNFGGQIFKRVFKNENFVNAHATRFFHWAKMWNWNYLQITSIEDLQQIKTSATPLNVIEILPEAGQTELFWNEWDNLCRNL